MVDAINGAKQAIVITESYGDAEINWDTRSMADTEVLLESALSYIRKKKAEEDAKVQEITTCIVDCLNSIKNLPTDKDGVVSAKEAQQILKDYANKIYRTTISKD